MSCTSDKTPPSRSNHTKTIPSLDELNKLIQIQARAIKKIAEIHQRDPLAVFRIFVQGFGWGGPRLGIAQDERKENDIDVEISDAHIVIAKKELAYVLSRGGVRIDHADSGWGGGFYVSRIYASSCG